MANNSDENKELEVSEVSSLSEQFSRLDIAAGSFYANPERIQTLEDLSFATGSDSDSTSTSDSSSGSGSRITEFVAEGVKTFDLQQPVNVVTIPFVEYDEKSKEKKLAEAKASVEKHEQQKEDKSRDE